MELVPETESKKIDLDYLKEFKKTYGRNWKAVLRSTWNSGRPFWHARYIRNNYGMDSVKRAEKAGLI